MTPRTLARSLAAGAGGAALLLALATLAAQRPLPDQLEPPAPRTLLLDAAGAPLPLRPDGDWNLAQQVALVQVPAFLREAVVQAEDRRYWQHRGVDWRARIAAAWQNLRALRAVRGASTISEQVVRMLHPRPRTVWSRWVEGFEAMRLERRFGKAAVLEFWLNQVPYGGHRRGVAPAAQWHFGRGLETLSRGEMLALAVLPRAPSRLDPVRNEAGLRAPMQRLAAQLAAAGIEDADALADAAAAPLAARRHRVETGAAHFRAAVARAFAADAGARTPAALRTSLDATLQEQAERLLRQRIAELAGQGVHDGALLVVELAGAQVRAWASASLGDPDDAGLDAVRAARQPGSTLKPFLYALAFEQGWTPDTPVDDAPLAEHVGLGQHVYTNYSRTYRGAVPAREALGNSLNLPALRALQFVGTERFLSRLRALGMDSLTGAPEQYGDGLALGNGEVPLFELVQAYAALAAGGEFRALSLFAEPLVQRPRTRVIDAEAAASVSRILSDPQSRWLEFGDGGVLRYPVQTAVKTGTSSDYRDAWTVAYNARWVVGAWLGNLDRRETDGVTGSVGPALLVQSVLAELPEAGGLLVADAPPQAQAAAASMPAAAALPAAWIAPFDGLQLALDPRVPDAEEAFRFELRPAPDALEYTWFVDGEEIGRGAAPTLLWPLRAGTHRAEASVRTAAGEQRLPAVTFAVQPGSGRCPLHIGSAS